MRHGCTVAVAAMCIAGWGLTPVAEAACNARNPTACTSDSQPQAAAPKAAAPLQLKRFIKLGPARRSVSRSARRHNRHVAHGSRTRKEAAPAARDVEAKAQADVQAKMQAPASQDTSTQVTPKSVPTVSIPARALALAPTTGDRTVGFAAATEPWSGEGSFADTDAPATLPPGVTIPRWDEVNAIDLAADEKTSERAGNASLARSVSLVTPANAGTRSAGSAASKPETGTSWLSWLYEKVFDGALAAVLAIRSMFA